MELTRAADASSALLWGTGNALSILWILGAFDSNSQRLLFIDDINLAEPALKAGPDASPPSNLRNGMILQASFACVLGVLVIPFRGEQKRRKQDALDVSEVAQKNLEVSAPGESISGDEPEGVEQRPSTADTEVKRGSIV